ncbi:MAG: immunoglobulin domain-containing protein [Phycisphaerae bacterium]
MKIRQVVWWAAMVLVAGNATSVHAADLWVPAQYPTIQSAIDAAAHGDRIRVAPGLYEESVSFRGKAVVVRAEGGPAVTTIRKPEALRSPTVVFEQSESRASILQGFTITGGTGRFTSLWPCDCDGYQLGGGIFIAGASPTVLDCRIVQNNCFTYFSRGGGAYVDGSAMFEGCSFEDNNAGGGYGRGGGIYVAGGSPVIVNSRVARCLSNSYHYGFAGGIFVAGGAPTLRHVVLTQNNASHGPSSLSTNASTTLEGVHVSGARSPASEGDYRDEGGNSLAGDCNANGLDDLQDIAAGRSADSNGDRVPDECQTLGAWVVQPADATVGTGGNVALVASVNVAASYRWFRNGAPLQDGERVSGSASGRLIINALDETDFGFYECEATFGGQSVRTVRAFLRPCGPGIATQPTDQSVGVDMPVFFAVEMPPRSGCEPPLRYQWQRRNPMISDPAAPGAWIDLTDGGGFLNTTSSILGILRPTPGLATGYRCRIIGACSCNDGTGGFVYSTNTVNFTVACPADFNADGGVDFNDVEEFFFRWENGC